MVPLLMLYIMDLTHLINTLNELGEPPDVFLCILDATILYTNIPHNECISVTKEMLAIHRQPLDLPYSSYIVELFRVVFVNNYFEFDETHYHQVSGTAMGQKLAPSYANLYDQILGKTCIHISFKILIQEQASLCHHFNVAPWPGIPIRNS